MGQLGPLLLLLTAALLLREVPGQCDVTDAADCNAVSIVSTTCQITVGDPAENVTIQSVQYLNGTTVPQSEITNNTVSNLTPGSQYVIVYGNSSLNCCQSITTYPERIPSANVTVRNNKSTNFLEVLWVPPPGNVELYVISLISTDTSYAAQWNQSKSDPPVVFRDLLPGREFNVTIQTVSGNLSNTSLPITQATYPSAPGPWISYSSTTTSISLNWTQPQNMTGAQYSFNVTYSILPGTVYSLNPGNQSSVQIPNLQSGTNYSIQIVTVGVLGYQSDPISISLYTNPERIPSANVTVRNNKSTNFLEVLWVPLPVNVELYVVSLISTDTSYAAQWNQSKSDPPVVFRDLLPGREFNVTIQTVSGNLSNTSLPITQATYPSAPGLWISYSSTTTSISLNWTQPQNMTGAQYSFNVTYSISPGTVYSLYPGNQSSVQIPNLQSGTNYSIQIVTVGVLGYQSDPISLSLYTNPERIPSANVTVRNNKSTNFLEVLWVPPPGNVELYVVSLISTDTSYAAQWNQSKSDPPVVFRGLLPGREFNVTIQTVSGNLSNTSLPITQATYPSAPGPWISYSSTTTSISLNWTQPQNMTGAQYSFNVTYSISSGTVYSLNPGNQSSVQIPNLQSGTNYSIQIVTVGVLGYQSDPISISLYTKPERIPSANVTVRNNKSTNFLEVLWVPPPGNVELYVVSLISTDTSYAAQWNQSKSDPPVVFRDLLPGREFNVTIQTVSGNLSNTSLPITQATYPSAPGPWISYSSTTTSISLNWTQPQNMTGAQYSFNITYSISSGTVYSLNPGNQSSVQIPNLQSGTNYSIQIVTVGVLGYQSDPISISLYTNPERIPSANVTVRNNKSTNFLEVLWVPPPGKVELYVVSLISTDSSYAAQWNQSKSDPPVVFRGLLPGREFNVTIQTVSGNLSNTSLPITQATYPSAPGLWISYSSTTTSISLNWTQPENMTGAQYSFNVTYSISPGTVYSLYPGNQSSVQIPNLQSGTNYSIQIVTVGVLGYQSDPISISLYTNPERIPSANVTVRNNKSTNFLEVLWVPPPGNVELYVISLISTDTSYAAQWNQNTTDPPVVFRGLLPGREFNVTIQTVSGNLSNTSLPITQATYPSAPGPWISYSSTTTSISLNWTQPQNMTGAQYSFNVTYSNSSGTVYSLNPGNQSCVQIPNLQSGTNYSIQIVTVGVLGYQSDPISISLYTNPERIPSANVTVRNNKSTNFLEVLWVPPPGKVELYVVSLISTDSSYAAQWNQSKSDPPVVFRGLLPGREFNVTIQTVSGNLSNTSLPITQATYPSAPGPWISYSSTTTSISLNWTQPQNMTGAQYSFNVTYSILPGTVYSLNPGNQSSVQIPNLQSGTNYSIRIVTVGVLGYQSDPISISLYTNPERIPSANVTVRNNKSTNFLEVLWVPPPGNVELYVVSLISTDTSYAAQWNQSKSDPPVVFRDLLPGREFNVTIQTVSGNLSNTSLPITQATYPSAPGPWISYSSTTTSISLNWTQPQNMTGAQYSFNVSYSNSSGTVYLLYPGNQSSVQIPNLQSGTNYSIQIVTVGVLGYQSDPISISLYTNPERIPSANVTVRNNKSTNFLEVLWVPPPGNVELYVVSIISTDTSYVAQWNQSKSDPPVVFRDLLPGREFNVTIQTVSRNLSNTSLPITQATYPSAPGPWISYSSTTTSISLNWTQPQNMTGTQYSFNVTYSISPGTVYSLYPGNQSSVQIPNLQSGTNYSIRIVTVGVLGYQSDPISISLYTNPERIPSANVTVRNNKSTNFLEVLWVPPPGNVELYVISLISTDTSYAAQWNQSKSAPPVVFRDLLPGREFNVTIQTVSGNLSNTSLPITQATYPSAPGPWISYSSTTTSISLSWTQPQNMTGAQYSFNVTYSISPGTVYSLNPGNQSSVQIPNLQSGTNYSIQIVTVGVLGYQSDPISISLYTNPERIPSANVTVINNKSTNFLEVLWVPPPGNVELYVVSLISTDTSYAAQWNQSKSDPPVVFRGLLPGREFNVTIQTVSGNLSNTSLPITQATYPSAPGPWISYSSTTTSISLNWTQPQNMTGAQYSFNVTYSILPGTVYSLYPGNQSSVQIPNLQSGTNYSIQIVTVGVLGYQSDPISISLYTKPERIPSANVTVRNNKSTNFLEVLWVPPPGNVELYVVSLISTDTSYAAQWNQSKSDPPVVFRGLLPGREFNVTIQTVSGNLSNTSLPITQATYPSAPGPWISYSSTTTSISLNWTQPQNMTGAQYSFNVTYSISPGTVYSLYPGNQSSVQIPNLQSGTNYSIRIVTVGVLGYQSDPISISLYTNPERIPSANVTVRNNKSTNFLEVLWVPPPGNVELYVISLISTDTSYAAQWNQSKSDPPVVFRGLLPGREFNVTIQTVSGNLSNTSLPITQATYPSAPGPWISYSSTTTSISLNWTQPQNMTGAQYSFNVTYSILPGTVYSLYPGNQSSVQIPNLQSGTNYSIQIVTVGVLGYQSDPISISLYTKPERIPSANVTVRNNKSTNFLEVLWVPPPGKVELYVVSLISTDTSYAAQWNQNATGPPVVFRDLLPGREFNVTIQTVSGNLSNTSLPITQATYPSAPGPWISYSSTTTSISLNWTQPQNMTGAQYSFNVTYSISPITVYSLNPGNQSSVQIPNLQSGTNYSIQIVTVGVLGYQSDPISISLYTNPERIPSANVTVRNNKSTNFLEVLWVPLPVNVELYVVSLISTDTSYAAQWNQSKSDPPVVFRGLLPGREFNVTIQTVSGNLSNTSLPITQATYPSAPGPWISYSSTTTSISLNWTQPQNMTGAQYSFNVTYSILPGTVYSLYPGNQSSVQIPNLQSGTNYSIQIVTVGVLGYQSDPISISLYTNPSAPGPWISYSSTTTSISLNWTQPQNMTGAQYSFNVTYSISPGTVYSLNPGNESCVQIPNLQSGTNYSIQIVTVGVLGYQSDPISISLYTNPERIPSANVTVRNNKSTNFLEVLWVPPPGNVELYVVSLISTDSSYAAQWNQSKSAPPVVFRGLLPGREFNVTIQTVSGNLSNTSLPITQATYPSAPGPWISYSSTTTSISLNWTQPQNMTGAQYSFNVTYSMSPITVYSLYPGNQSSVQIPNLQSGTNYSIQIVTVGVLGYQSDPISISLYTNPSAPGPWISYSSTTTSISLNWTQPQNMTGAQYSFNVTYSILPGTVYSLNPVIQSSVQIPNLQSGTNYSIQIVTVGVLGYQSDPISISLYTNPERIPSANVTVRNNKSTNFLEVLWVPPPGKVELYVISLISTDTSYAAQWNQSKSDPPVVFRGLLPGREFNVTIQTVSGNLSNTSLPITQATYPSAPGSWISYSSTTTSISLNWTQPQNMTGTQYSFNVTYSNSSGTVYSLYPGNQSSVQIPNLQSGTNYSIQIVTVGVLGYQSDPISISLYTNPERIPSANVTVRNNKSTNFLEVLWVPPPGNVELYVVSLISTDTSYAAQWNQNTSAPPVVFRGLLPGREFNVTIQTVSGNLSNTSLPITQATYPSAPGPWISNSSTTTSISLNWTQPQNMTGAQYSFNVTYSILPGTVYSLNPGNQSSVQIPNLQSGTNYSIQIVTVGVLGYQSDPISISLYTIPTPGAPASVPSSSLSPTEISYTFSAFSSIPGLIKAYAVIVTTDSNAGSPPSGILSKTYYDFKNKDTNAYVSQIKEFGQRNGRSAGQDTYTVTIGDNSTTRGYYNGPLQPGTSYRLAVAGFTNILFDNNSRVIESLSSVATTQYSSPITTAPLAQQDPGPIVGAVVGSILGATVIAILAFFIWRRRRHQEKGENVPFSSIKQAKTSQPIPKSGFEAHFRKQQANTNLGFSEEYEKFSSVGISQPKEASELPENKAKNRYNNVLPYDHSRVKLSAPNHQTEDYINANYMPGYMTSREFIAAQGPLPNTVTDFWRMIWEKNISAAVMLTRCVELGKVKCEQYWPSSGQKEFGDISVSLIEESVQPEWVIRDFTVTHKRENRSKHVRHFHFTAWPDHGVPKTTDVLIGFRNLLWDYVKLSPPNSPVLVHCSAGVGRTGTLIALDRIMKQIDKEDAVDVFGTVHSLRVHRVLMVQTENQYIFLNQCALDAIRAQRANQPDLIYQNSSAIYENVSRSLRLGNSRV
ncbi:tenascin-X-like isoform X13 [Xenopus tropicalis]|uniref:protein-tyrosine-phosphatase n=1 Tax=Xenopus tropicalis TaxID=8364 RepID=A0A8J1JHQ2_XENTR|nr:tenascin-X-like isoform X13 [Xenopus tropicalis]